MELAHLVDVHFGSYLAVNELIIAKTKIFNLIPE